MSKTKEKNVPLVNTKPLSNWKASYREFGGKRCYYRSRWEANYGRYLEFLKKQNEILEWEHEPETFWFEKIKRGVRSYLPDFRITEKDGSIVYHEVKGWMDSKSKTKIKRMRIYHPEIKLVIIDSKAYTKIEKQIASLLADWE